MSHVNVRKDARSTSRSTIQPLPGREGSHTMQRKNPKQFAIKKNLRRCVKCRRIEGQHYSLPQQPELPDERVSDDPPFAHTEIDFAGPLYTSEKVENAEDAKAYVCLFTCASTRAVHLELTKRLSAEAFMLAFRRFTSRRGLPATVLSDNAKTFKAASKDIVKIVRAKEVIQYMSNNGVTWKFIVEKAAWWGGFWERLVQNSETCVEEGDWSKLPEFRGTENLVGGSGKHRQRKTADIRLRLFRWDQLCTDALTSDQRSTPSGYVQPQSIRSYQHQKHLLHQFTETWRKDYLVSLRETHEEVEMLKLWLAT